MAKLSAKKRRTTKKVSSKNKTTDKKKPTAKKNDEDSSQKMPTLEVVQEAEKYLEAWQKKDEWRFKKSKQMWLIKWMYRPDVIHKTMFATLLEYLGTVKGNARERLLSRAHAIVEAGEPKEVALPTDEEDNEEKNETARVAYRLARRQYKRALYVVEVVA